MLMHRLELGINTRIFPEQSFDGQAVLLQKVNHSPVPIEDYQLHAPGHSIPGNSLTKHFTGEWLKKSKDQRAKHYKILAIPATF
jgi:hypothetical protein